MSSKAMSLKGRINNYAKKTRIPAQVVLQNFMFERFLERLAVSDFRQKFVIKGGMLIAALVGLDIRSTMDLDTTIRDLPLTEEEIFQTIKEIGGIDIGDEVYFDVKSIEPIRKDDKYGGFCVKLIAIFDTIRTPLSIDVSTGDVITPKAIEYEFEEIFNEDKTIKLWGYNIETILAEKVETIFRRGVFNTRPRDFYDVYILTKEKIYDKDIFVEALQATATHRGSTQLIVDKQAIFNEIFQSNDLRNMWSKYRQKYPYANDIEYEEIMDVLKSFV